MLFKRKCKFNSKQKHTKNIDYKIDKKLYDLKAPIKKNTKVGVLKISYDNKEYSYDLIVKEDIKKASFLKTYFNLFKDIISGTKS